MRLKNKLKQHLNNIPGWRTKRRIVVLESDDWGTIRTPSREILERLRKEGIEVDKCHYMRYDSLESEEDLELLFDVLKEPNSPYTDSYNRTIPIIRAGYNIALFQGKNKD